MVEHNLAKVGVASSSLVSRSSSQGKWILSHRLLSVTCAFAEIRFPFLVCVASHRNGATQQVAQHGGVAEWSCSGLQSRGRRFDSDPRLHLSIQVDPRTSLNPRKCEFFIASFFQ